MIYRVSDIDVLSVAMVDAAGSWYVGTLLSGPLKEGDELNGAITETGIHELRNESSECRMTVGMEISHINGTAEDAKKWIAD